MLSLQSELVKISNKDIFLYWRKFLSDFDINKYLSLSKILYNLKFCIEFNEEHELDSKISNLKYYQSFTNLIITKNCPVDFLPDKIIKVNFKFCRMKLLINISKYHNLKKIKVTVDDKINLNLIKNIPITHLKFMHGYYYVRKIMPGDLSDGIIKLDLGNEYCYDIIKNVIPATVKYLNVGMAPIKKNSLPPSVTHLRTSIITEKDHIPKSITHITLDGCIYKILSSNVTHLIFKKYYKLSENYAPGLTHLTLPDMNPNYIIPQTVKYLVLPKEFRVNIPNVFVTYI